MNPEIPPRDQSPDPPSGRRFDNVFNGSAVHNVVQIGSVEHLHMDGCCASSDLRHGRHRSRWGESRPIDLVKLRLWIAEITTQYQDRETERPSCYVDSSELKDALAETDDSAQCVAFSMVRRLAVAGVANYLARVEAPPAGAIPEWIMIDLLVFAMWPVITARKLPPGWQSDVAALTSPRVAVLVDKARASRRGGGAEYAAEEFASAVALRDCSFAIVNLFEDLRKDGGAQLRAMAVAADLEKGWLYSKKGIFLWAMGIAAGGAALTELAHHGQELADFAADLFEDPNPSPADSGGDSSSDSVGSGGGFSWDSDGGDGGDSGGDGGGD